jgi:polar amino acid transport system permease protein
MREFATSDFFWLLFAARWTIALSVVSILCGSVLGALIMVLRVVPFAPARAVAMVYINVIQGTPVLGQLFVIFFGLGIFGYNVSAWTAAIIAFSLYSGAFLGEIWRGGVHAVPKTQWEASASIGLSTLEQLRYVIIPQAFRLSIPPTIGFWVHLVKNTSLASIIGFIELTRAGQIINAATFRPMTVYLTIGACYFVICFTLTRLSSRLEGSLRVAR